MQTIDNMAYDAIESYYNVITKLGHKSGINRVLILVFLSWFMEVFAKYINESDYNTIVRVLYCISGDCLIHLPNFETFKDDIVHKNVTSSTLRIMEQFKFKDSGAALFRILE